MKAVTQTNGRPVAVPPDSPPRTGQPRVSVVILSYNRPAQLAAALDSVRRQTYQSLEIIVIDNPSPGSDAVAELVGAMRDVRLIRNPENNGYTGGMNLGIREVTGEYTLLTEDDMVLAPTCVAELMNAVTADPAIGLASGLIRLRGTRTIVHVGGTVTLGQAYRQCIFGAGEQDEGQFTTPFPVNYVTGALMLAPTRLLRALGGFHPGFFMYFEDTEFCFRVAHAQRSIVVVPSAVAETFEAEPGTPSLFIEYHKFKNLVALSILWAPLFALPSLLFGTSVLHFIKIARGRRRLVRPHLKAWGWVAWRLPRLLWERLTRRHPATR